MGSFTYLWPELILCVAMTTVGRHSLMNQNPVKYNNSELAEQTTLIMISYFTVLKKVLAF